MSKYSKCFEKIGVLLPTDHYKALMYPHFSAQQFSWQSNNLFQVVETLVSIKGSTNMMDQPTSPTSMLWAYKLRRENKELHSRIDALESQNTTLTKQVTTSNTDLAAIKVKVEILEAATKEHEDDKKQITVLTHKVAALEKKLWSSLESGSQATTVDEEAVSFVAPVIRKSIPTKNGPTVEDQILQRNLNSLQQKGMSTRQYVELTESVLQSAHRASEIVIVKAFVLGIAEEKQRVRTESRLVKRGWTWQVAKEAFEDVEKPTPAKRKAPQRYIIPPEEAKRLRAQGVTF
ncbi:MAG: hypothetical protein M1812_002894 [Candelaria pacifica]|nr:MAG: hypothetical protein M1812_002894 [Candelaria pacifica]